MIIVILMLLITIILIGISSYFYINVDNGTLFNVPDREEISEIKVNNKLLEKIVGEYDEREEIINDTEETLVRLIKPIYIAQKELEDEIIEEYIDEIDAEQEDVLEDDCCCIIEDDDNEETMNNFYEMVGDIKSIEIKYPHKASKSTEVRIKTSSQLMGDNIYMVDIRNASGGILPSIRIKTLK
jgi:hypothetical protein